MIHDSHEVMDDIERKLWVEVFLLAIKRALDSDDSLSDPGATADASIRALRGAENRICGCEFCKTQKGK
jgi:hypothetical protein